MNEQLASEDRRTLLDLARSAVTAAANRQQATRVEAGGLSPALCEPAACFVTLKRRETGDLRGCTGVLYPRLSLAEEVSRTAWQSACRDPRFPPVTPAEVPGLSIEISILTPPQPITPPTPSDLPAMLQPGVHGVTLRRGYHRATFLPQVWDKLPDPVDFLNRLCIKMGLPAGAWREPGFEVEVYTVETICDDE
jgi:AmmeMemoRadiSam system protein A